MKETIVVFKKLRENLLGRAPGKCRVHSLLYSCILRFYLHRCNRSTCKYVILRHFVCNLAAKSSTQVERFFYSTSAKCVYTNITVRSRS